jgi:hypothetical protein
MGQEACKAVSRALQKLGHREGRGTDLHPGKVPFHLPLSGSVISPHQLVRYLHHDHNGFSVLVESRSPA